MKVLKWMLIVAGSVVVLLTAAGIGGYFYVVSGPSLELSAKDLDVGSPWPATERAAFVSTCVKAFAPEQRERTPALCECIAKDAETEASRAERLMVAAVLEENWRQMAKVALAAGTLEMRTGKSLEIRDISENLKRNCGKRL